MQILMFFVQNVLTNKYFWQEIKLEYIIDDVQLESEN